jgi:hypothetical protein
MSPHHPSILAKRRVARAWHLSLIQSASETQSFRVRRRIADAALAEGAGGAGAADGGACEAQAPAHAIETKVPINLPREIMGQPNLV